jgi:NSS family neurotransmitter:Na+ symporter
VSQQPREQWSSRAGFIIAAVGGAIGLGNVWKFPYVTGQYGGASFLVVYAIALIAVALPVIMVELAVGRKTQRNLAGALRELMPGTRWYLLGVTGVLTFVLVLSFYFGVAGWTLAYLVRSATGSYATSTPAEIATSFELFLNNPLELIGWQLTATVITGWVVAKGVRLGIEKACTVLLPALFLVIVALAAWSISLPGASAGIEFYLSPDWSKLNGEAVLAAVGQAFFTLGVGCGGMVIYGSYLDRKQTIPSNAIIITGGDFAAALLVGLLIFPAAFAFGIDPELAGPPLVFLTLPSVFVQMPFGMLFASLFYMALAFACLTSTLAILEAVVGYIVDEWGWSRKKAVWGSCTLISVLGTAQMLSFGPWSELLVFNRTLFELSDLLVSSILLPLCGLLTLLLAGWVLGQALWDEFNLGEGLRLGPFMKFSIRYIAPAAVAAVLVNGLYGA